MDFRLGRGRGVVEEEGALRTSLGIVEMEEVGDDGTSFSVAGTMVLAAVDGLISWVGDGCRRMWADCIVEASSAAGLWAMMAM
jgi:hypothetical protein